MEDKSGVLAQRRPGNLPRSGRHWKLDRWCAGRKPGSKLSSDIAPDPRADPHARNREVVR
jgi:hypothetical protein